MRQDWSDERIERELHALRGEMGARFEKIDVQLKKIDVQLEKIDSRFEKIDDRFEQIHLRFDTLHRTMIQFCTVLVILLGSAITALVGIAFG